jgi:hypothetical protein
MSRPHSSPGDFASWMRLVDAIVSAKVGVSVHDLPDCCFSDWPTTAFRPSSPPPARFAPPKTGGNPP